MKGVILCGGFGKRMLYSTRNINKHLLPVYSIQGGATPMIFYPIHTLSKSGIKEILIITSDEAAGLMIETLGDGKKFGVDFTYKIQNMHDKKNPVGIAGALKLAYDFVKDGPFAVILGDNFFEDNFSKEIKDYEEKYNSIRFSSNPNDSSFAHTFLKEVSDPERFGVATMNEGKITNIIEKPTHPESNLAVCGLYLFNPMVFPLLENLKVSKRGELEVSEINDWYVKNGEMTATIMKGYWSDMGIPSSMHKTMDYINNSSYIIDSPKE